MTNPNDERARAAWDLLCIRLQRDPVTSEETDTTSLRAAWKAILAFATAEYRRGVDDAAKAIRTLCPNTYAGKQFETSALAAIRALSSTDVEGGGAATRAEVASVQRPGTAVTAIESRNRRVVFDQPTILTNIHVAAFNDGRPVPDGRDVSKDTDHG